MRDHHLRARRLKLGRTAEEIGYLANFGGRHPGAHVCNAEIGKAAPRVQKVRAALIYLESPPRRLREQARREAAERARIEEVLAAPRCQEGEMALINLAIHGRPTFERPC